MTISRGDVVLVTGASGAIGFEIAAQAAEAGAVVAVHGSHAKSVAKAIERLRARVAEAQLIAAPADFREEGAIEAMIEKVAVAAGRLDAVIHCGITGGAGVAGPFATATPASFGEHAALVLGSFQRLSFAALPHLAAFGGIMSFARNLALEVSRQAVRVHCISPSFVADTPAFEKYAARAGTAFDRAGLGLPTPKDIAPVALFLCGPNAAKITGQIISINGGLNA